MTTATMSLPDGSEVTISADVSCVAGEYEVGEVHARDEWSEHVELTEAQEGAAIDKLIESHAHDRAHSKRLWQRVRVVDALGAEPDL